MGLAHPAESVPLERAIVLSIERDLGTERGEVLPGKIRRYRSLFGGRSPLAQRGFRGGVWAPGALYPEPIAPLADWAANPDHHRRTAGCRPDRRALGRWARIHPHARLEACGDTDASVLTAGCLADPDALAAFDDRAAQAMSVLRPHLR
jgi:hypothetical protein